MYGTYLFSESFHNFAFFADYAANFLQRHENKRRNLLETKVQIFHTAK
jgi:hypothetical protein